MGIDWSCKKENRNKLTCSNIIAIIVHYVFYLNSSGIGLLYPSAQLAILK